MAVYLDHAATTRVHPEVASRLLELLSLEGNAASAHSAGRAAKAVLERARLDVAQALGVRAREVTFVGTATEGLWIALRGLELAPDDVVATSPFEHEAVRAALGSERVVELPVGLDGQLDVRAARACLRECGAQLRAVVVASATGETGVVQPVSAIARLARTVRADVLVVSDLVAAAPAGLDVSSPALRALRVADVAVLAPHKFGGPSGVGILVVREGVQVRPLVVGGGQERGLRGGTQAVWLAGGAARACELAAAQGAAWRATLEARRRYFEQALRACVPDAVFVGESAERVGISLVAVPGVRSEELVVLLDGEGICVSAGSACEAGAPRPSPGLVAMGWSHEAARSVVRVSFAPSTSTDDLDLAVAAFRRVVGALRGAA